MGRAAQAGKQVSVWDVARGVLALGRMHLAYTSPAARSRTEPHTAALFPTGPRLWPPRAARARAWQAAPRRRRPLPSRLWRPPAAPPPPSRPGARCSSRPWRVCELGAGLQAAGRGGGLVRPAGRAGSGRVRVLSLVGPRSACGNGAFGAEEGLATPRSSSWARVLRCDRIPIAVATLQYRGRSAMNRAGRPAEASRPTQPFAKPSPSPPFRQPIHQ